MYLSVYKSNLDVYTRMCMYVDLKYLFKCLSCRAYLTCMVKCQPLSALSICTNYLHISIFAYAFYIHPYTYVYIYS